jgi:sensor histidine kinase YesM
VKTGNASLDVVLTDKNYICDGSGIKLYYVIEKDAINFMSSEDIYSLFNNMIDNAIEAVKKENPSDRVIKIKAYRKGQMIAISCENYTSVKPHFSEGLPLTSKDDRVTHGFGTLSIRRVAEKYAGNVIFKVENNIFLVSIMLSAPASGIEPAPAETQK